MDRRSGGYNSTGSWGVERKGHQKNSGSEVVSLVVQRHTMGKVSFEGLAMKKKKKKRN